MSENSIIPVELIAERIYIIRGQKVMLDSDLAVLYGTQTMRLNERVRRNMNRFPEDFMFQLTETEFTNLKSQIAISSWGGRRKLPLAFTEQGVTMLSSVLNSDTAIEVNIAIMRAFIKMREILYSNKELAIKVEKHDKEIATLYACVENLLYPKNSNKKQQIGYIWESDKKKI